jgi:hypothetical protein
MIPRGVEIFVGVDPIDRIRSTSRVPDGGLTLA